MSGGTNSAREEFAKNVSSATTKHSAKASSQRNVEVNTNFEIKEQTGEETTISREIKNINVGNTLNLLFNQLNQEMITILHLVDVRVSFNNGYGESTVEVPLSDLDNLLETYIVTKNIDEVKNSILSELMSRKIIV